MPSLYVFEPQNVLENIAYAISLFAESMEEATSWAQKIIEVYPTHYSYSVCIPPTKEPWNEDARKKRDNGQKLFNQKPPQLNDMKVTVYTHEESDKHYHGRRLSVEDVSFAVLIKPSRSFAHFSPEDFKRLDHFILTKDKLLKQTLPLDSITPPSGNF